jgi:hypothetical protein
MRKWAQPYHKGFNEWIQDKHEDQTSKVKEGLYNHQAFTKFYLRPESPYRGLLLYHGLGVGKTRSAISICEFNKKDVVVLLPASLIENFKNEVNQVTKNKPSVNYEYISYNGLNMKLLNKIVPKDDNSQSIFHNKTVVIDEYHNFITSVKNGSLLCGRVYKALLSDISVKLICLTGTPIINVPNEIAYSLNLIHGYIYTFSFGTTDNTKAIEIIKSHEIVAQCRLDPNNSKRIHVNVVTPGFRKSKDAGLIVNMKEELGSELSVQSIKDVLEKKGVKLSTPVSIFTNDLLPTNTKDFNEIFLEGENSKLFQRRIQGLVSYYEHYNVEDYPRTKPLKIVKLPFTELQLTKYGEVRAIEIKMEMKSKKNKKATLDEDKDISLYRSYTRAVCNFVFPKKVSRNFGKHFLTNMDPEETEDYTNDLIKTMNDDGDESKSASAEVDLEKLRAYLTEEKLVSYSPKMLAILNNVNSAPGPCVIYSCFRNVEGVRIMSMVFEENGWTELRIKKTVNKKYTLDISRSKAEATKNTFVVFGGKGKEDKTAANILMSIFNNKVDDLRGRDDIDDSLFKLLEEFEGNLMPKVILLTKSGSEGISLQNVRQVHMMEPYWNNIRIQQVIGRAVRANSHKSLPLKDRLVETFLYLMVAETEDQQAKLNPADNGMSTDEYIYDVSQRKAKINETFLKYLKESSVDCQVHKKVHNIKKCFVPGNENDYVYSLSDIKDDVEDRKEVVQKGEVQKKVVKKKDAADDQVQKNVMKKTKIVVNEEIVYYKLSEKGMDVVPLYFQNGEKAGTMQTVLVGDKKTIQVKPIK